MKIRKVPLTLKPNSRLIPVSQGNFNDENIELANNIIKECKRKNYSRIIRTNSGGISYDTVFPAFDVRNTKSLFEITVLDKDGMYRLQLRNVSDDNLDSVIPGWKCFQTFKNLCSEYNIDLTTYEIDNGKEVKEEIEKYIIKLENGAASNITFDNAHHIDFHSAFPSGLIETHPEFTAVITKLYNERKDNPTYKQILVATIGYMQSESCCKAKWAHLSRDAINRNNEKLRDLAKRLTKAGRCVLAYNTDGIWYTGKIYHAQGEGAHLTEWSNDHTNCKIRFKSAGSYEYIEDGKYTPVVRGHTKLDDIKDRSNWTWGDIYNIDATPVKYKIGEDELIYKEVVYE